MWAGPQRWLFQHLNHSVSPHVSKIIASHSWLIHPFGQAGPGRWGGHHACIRRNHCRSSVRVLCRLDSCILQHVPKHTLGLVLTKLLYNGVTSTVTRASRVSTCSLTPVLDHLCPHPPTPILPMTCHLFCLYFVLISQGKIIEIKGREKCSTNC